MPSNILVLVAGTNQPSNSDTLANAFIQGVEQIPNMKVEKILLRTLKIDHFTVDNYSPACNAEEDFCKVQDLIQAAHGVVIASPIWNFSVPGHLKNLIDRMGSFALDERRNKGTLKGLPFYFVFTGGTPMIGWTALMKKTVSHMPESIRYFGGTPIGTHYEPKCTAGPGKFELVVDKRPESLSSVRKQGHDFAQIVAKYAKDGSLPAGKRMWNKLFSWGGDIVKKI